MFEIIVPKIDANTEEVTLLEWLKSEGQEVKKGEALFVVETAKAVVEVDSQKSGFLRKIITNEKDRVKILDVVGLIGDKNEPLQTEAQSKGKGIGKKTFGIPDITDSDLDILKDFSIVKKDNQKVTVSEPQKNIEIQQLDGDYVNEGKLNSDFVAYLREDYSNNKKFGKLSSEEKIDRYVKNGAIIDEGVHIGKNTYIISEYLMIGSQSIIGDDSFIDSLRISIGKICSFNQNLIIQTKFVKIGDLIWADNNITIGGGGHNSPESQIMIGDRCFIGAQTRINTAEPVIIGNQVAIGEGVYIYTHSHWLSAIEGYPVLYGGVILKDKCWLGTNCTVLPGISIGKGTVVTVGSVVMNNIPDGSLATGNPAKVIRENFPTKLDAKGKDKIMRKIMEKLAKQFTFQGFEVVEKSTETAHEISIGKNLIYYSYEIEKIPKDHQNYYLIAFAFGDNISDDSIKFDLEKLEINGKRDEFYDEIREQLRRHGIKFEKPFLWRYQIK